MDYEIVITDSHGWPEVIDGSDDKADAEYLLGEYALVYANFPEMDLRLEVDGERV